MFEHLALTGWLEADQAELTVLHRQEIDGALRATAYRFCASSQSLELTGAFAWVPAGNARGLSRAPPFLSLPRARGFVGIAHVRFEGVIDP